MLRAAPAILAWAFFILWFGGGVMLFVPARIAQNRCLRQFDELKDVPLDGIPLGMPRGAWGVIWDEMMDYQFDPALEASRRAMWRRWRWMVAWIFGFPLTVVAIMVALILTGHGALLG